MLDPNFIRENTDLVKKGVTNRQMDAGLVDKWLKLDKTYLELLQKSETLRAERNKLADKLKGTKGKPAEADIKKGRKIREDLQKIETELKEAKDKWQEAALVIPNVPADDVPIGKDDTDNVEIKKWGEIPKFDFKVKDHLEIGEALGIIDVKRAANVSGSRFGYFKGDGALMELALMWYVFQKLAQKDYIPVIPPVITKKEIERGLGYAENGGWEQAYLFEKDDIVFISSSEHSVIPMYTGEIIDEKLLPMRHVNFSTCFRREAGTYGKDTRGIFRVHQFNKVEMNVYTTPDTKVSDKECLNLLAAEEEIMQDLKLPYRVMSCCTGDIPFPNRRMYDLETWFPGQGEYRETQSCSNCVDYQTRRLNIRTKTKKGTEFVHALNATAITDRAVIAILENYQQKDGTVIVPEVLRSWVGKEAIK